MNNLEKNTYVKKHITNALLKMLEMHKVEDISIRSLCKAAGVSRASFYRNYKTKEDVIHEHADRLIKIWSNEFESDPESSFFNVFYSLFCHCKRNAAFYTMLYKQGLSDVMLDTILKKVGFSSELSNKDVYEKAWLAYAIYGIVSEWIRRGMCESPEELNELIIGAHKL